jgi:CHAT domain-containing protein
MSFKLTYVVAPRYSSERQLAHAEEEAKLVAKSFPPSRRIDPASVATLDKSLAKNSVSLLHFVCHGKAQAPQTIYMDDEKDNLVSLQVKTLEGFQHTFEEARTFVFLNACEVGRPAPALVGIGGLANEFLAIGAGGVIAPLWSVADDVAFDVAKEFYSTIKKSPKKPFASILQEIRRKAYEGAAEDTWAAYCFYGDPLAALRLSG